MSIPRLDLSVDDINECAFSVLYNKMCHHLEDCITRISQVTNELCYKIIDAKRFASALF